MSIDEQPMNVYWSGQKSSPLDLGLALDNEVIHLTGDETVAGVKTFTDPPVISFSGGKYVKIKNSSITAGTPPSSSVLFGIRFTDTADTVVSSVKHAYYKAGSTMLQIICNDPASANTIGLYVGYPSTGDPYVRPSTNGTVNCGSADTPWKEVFSATAAINTSDMRLKDNIEAVSEAVLDAWGDVGWVQFQFAEALASKGENARVHAGLIAQRIDAAFKAHGLDASRYGLFCYDSWDADEENGIEAGDRYSLRYQECLAVEAAYQRRRADRLEARIRALEIKLA